MAKQKAEFKRQHDELMQSKKLLMKVCDEKATFEYKHKEKTEYINKIEGMITKGKSSSAITEMNKKLNSHNNALKDQLTTLQKEFELVCDKNKDIVLRNAALDEALVNAL